MVGKDEPGKRGGPVKPGRKLAFAVLAPLLVWAVLEALAAVSLAVLPDGEESAQRSDLPSEDRDWLVSARDGLRRSFFVEDPNVLWVLRPNHRAPQIPGGLWGNEPMRLNAFGHRSPAVTRDKPGGVRRVLVLGGSQPFGMWVGDSEVYSTVLSTLLNEQSPDGWEVLNASSPGHTTFQGRQYLSHQGLDFEPDVVIFDLGNNDDLELSVSWSAPDHEVAAVSATARRAGGIASRSAVYRLLRRLLEPAQQPSDARVRVPPEQRDENMRFVQALAQEHGFEVMWMSQVDVGEDPNQATVHCVYRFEDWEPRTDVCGLFEPYGSEARRFFVDAIHATPEGHRMIGELLFQRFGELGWLDPR